MAKTPDHVNAADRRKMALLMRQFASGRLTVIDFEDSAFALDQKDTAISSAFVFAWGQYCDFRTVRLEGKWKLSRQRRRIWTHWILYLYTNEQPYPWAGLIGTPHWLKAAIAWLRGKSIEPEPPLGWDRPEWPFKGYSAVHAAERLFLERMGPLTSKKL